jgi:hypothetical protein
MFIWGFNIFGILMTKGDKSIPQSLMLGPSDILSSGVIVTGANQIRFADIYECGIKSIIVAMSCVATSTKADLLRILS